jgi:hypothetical protein
VHNVVSSVLGVNCGVGGSLIKKKNRLYWTFTIRKKILVVFFELNLVQSSHVPCDIMSNFTLT